MRETPCRMTEKLSLASLMTLRMRAAQPTVYRSPGARILGARVALGDDADDRPLLRDRLLDEPHRLLAPDVDGDDRTGEQHRVAQRQDRDDFGDLDGTLVFWGVFFF